MKWKDRWFFSILLMAAGALGAAALCLYQSRDLFEGLQRAAQNGSAVYHLKKVSDAFAVDIVGAVQKTRNGATWSWEEGGQAIKDAAKEADENWRAYTALDLTKDEKYLSSIVQAGFINNQHLLEQLQAAFAGKDARQLEILATSVIYPSIDPMIETLRKLEELHEKTGEEALALVTGKSGANFQTMALGAGGILLAGFVAAFLIGGNAHRPVRGLARSLAAGAAQARPQAERSQSTLLGLQTGLDEEGNILRQSTGTLDQALALAQQNADGAGRSRHLMEETRVTLTSGTEASDRTLAHLRGLHDNSEKIQRIVKTMEDIAFQTNILALNAGVEAVRAGEQGKEFVVVVEEIRNLSQRCAQVARESTQLMSENSRQAGEGLRSGEDAARALAQTGEKAKKIADLLTLLEMGCYDQSKGAQDIVQALDRVEKSAARNSTACEKAATAGQQLTQQLESLEGLSRQLGQLIDGASRPVLPPLRAPQDSPAPKEVPGRQESRARAESAAPPRVKNDSLSEKTGTDGTKVIRLNNT
jgi:methyl-accepting chemotaxis protein